MMASFMLLVVTLDAGSHVMSTMTNSIVARIGDCRRNYPPTTAHKSRDADWMHSRVMFSVSRLAMRGTVTPWYGLFAVGEAVNYQS